MLSGGAAGLVSVDILRKEQEEIRKREKRNQPLEGLLKSNVAYSKRKYCFIS